MLRQLSDQSAGDASSETSADPGLREAVTAVCDALVAVYILFWSAIFILAAVLCAVSINAANQCREAVKSIGRDCAPSIIAAQQIKQDLAKLDANSADFLLAKNANLPIYQELQTQAKTLKNQFSDSLVTAAQNITFGDSERIPITKLSSGIIQYCELVADANPHQNNEATPLIANAVTISITSSSPPLKTWTKQIPRSWITSIICGARVYTSNLSCFP